jgi:hypothetical protein
MFENREMTNKERRKRGIGPTSSDYRLHECLRGCDGQLYADPFGRKYNGQR